MKKQDIILICSIVLVIVLSLIIVKCIDKKASYAHVFHEGKEIITIDLSVDKEYSILDGDMLLRVKNKKIGVIESNCSDHTCIHIGMTNTSSNPIICAPNKIYIKVDNHSGGLDVVVG